MRGFFLSLLLFVLYTTACGQVIETFSDGDFSNNPVWAGTATSWMVNGNRQLQSNNTTANSIFYISTANTLAVATQWEFFIRLQFNTSSQNYADAWLMASAADLSLPGTTGYFVRIGNTDDEIALYRKDANGTAVKIIDGANGITTTSDNTLRIKVIRTVSHQFMLLRDVTGSGDSYAVEGSITDAAYTTSAFFGFLVRQSTSSFFSRHYFDDIVVQPYVPDVTPPVIRSVTVVSANQLDILFSEPVTPGTSENRGNYSVNNGLGNPATAQQDANNSAQVHLTFSSSFPNGQINTITINGVQDLMGNVLNNGTAPFSFSIVQPLDVIVNEILFNPKPGGSDYVELYNRSNKIIDISQLSIANRNSSGVLSSIRKIAAQQKYLAPGEYLVLTQDSTDLRLNYFVKNPAAVLQISPLPSFPDAEGTVIIVGIQNTIIDEVRYHEKWHFELLRDREAVALERINPEVASQDAANWQSAAAAAGYGTPGYENSQLGQNNLVKAAIEVTPKTFSPDGDGVDDVAVINYQVMENGYVGNVTIFDAAGRLVRNLVRNQTLGLRGSWQWNGWDDKGRKLSIGTYIIYTEIFNLQGKKERFKNAVVLAGKLSEP